MPRTKDEIWKQFNEVTLANGTIRAECKGCKASIVGLVSRMKTHFEACSKKRAAPQNTTDDEPTPKQTKKSTLPFLTCGAHFLNLLAKDICQSKETKTALSKVLEIVKYLRNTHSALAKLREKQLSKPPIPVKTRWNSQQEMVKYFISHWMEIACIISSLLNRSDRLYQYLEDIQLKRVCMDMLEVLDPVASALDSMQKDSTTVSDSMVIWKHLLEKCPGSHKEFVVRRMNMAISPAVMAANLLDHRYQGSKLTSIEMTAAFDHI